MRAIGRRGAAEVAVLRGTAVGNAGAGAGGPGLATPRRFPGLTEKIGKFVGGRSRTRRTRRARR
jgi:hypothetical protein